MISFKLCDYDQLVFGGNGLNFKNIPLSIYRNCFKNNNESIINTLEIVFINGVLVNKNYSIEDIRNLFLNG